MVLRGRTPAPPGPDGGRRAPSRERCCARPGSWPTGKGRCSSSCGPPSTSPVRPRIPSRRRELAEVMARFPPGAGYPELNEAQALLAQAPTRDMTGPPRVLVLGGGMAGLVAAWRLSEPGWRERFSSITVLERGFRLGGKGASSRGAHGRVEEHGLHVWLGHYDNAFRVMRECYAELDRDRTDPGLPDPQLARGLPARPVRSGSSTGTSRLGAVGGDVLDRTGSAARRAGRRRPRPLGGRDAAAERAADPRLLRLARARPAADAGPALALATSPPAPAPALAFRSIASTVAGGQPAAAAAGEAAARRRLAGPAGAAAIDARLRSAARPAPAGGRAPTLARRRLHDLVDLVRAVLSRDGR